MILWILKKKTIKKNEKTLSNQGLNTKTGISDNTLPKSLKWEERASDLKTTV